MPNGFYSNLTLFIIPRVGHSILRFAQHLDRELVNRCREGCRKIMIELFNIILIWKEFKSLFKSFKTYQLYFCWKQSSFGYSNSLWWGFYAWQSSLRVVVKGLWSYSSSCSFKRSKFTTCLCMGILDIT